MKQNIFVIVLVLGLIFVPRYFWKEPPFHNEPELQPTNPPMPEWIPEDGSPVPVNVNFCMIVATYGDIVMLDCGEDETHITNESNSVGR